MPLTNIIQRLIEPPRHFTRAHLPPRQYIQRLVHIRQHPQDQAMRQHPVRVIQYTIQQAKPGELTRNVPQSINHHHQSSPLL